MSKEEILNNIIRLEKNYVPDIFVSKNLFRFLKNPFRFILSLFMRILPFSITVTSYTFFGYKIKSIMYSYDGFGLYVIGSLLGVGEYKLIKFLTKNLKENDIFYDVGANFGFYTLLASALLKNKGQVHSFEPSPVVYELLTKSISLNKDKIKCAVFPHKFALSSNLTKLELFYSIKEIGGASVEELIANEKGFGKKETVDAITLDYYVETLRHTPPTVIKIDVEGHEKKVILGGLSTLQKFQPIIISEIWPLRMKGHIYHIPLLRMLQSLAYEPYFIDLNGDLQRISYEHIKNKIFEDKGDNYVFIRRNKLV
jgi:FkbM family methyltransferase